MVGTLMLKPGSPRRSPAPARTGCIARPRRHGIYEGLDRHRPQPPSQPTVASCALAPTSRPLIEISPVGVVVFDAKSGRPVSLNREARRIVESLRTPGRPPEQLLEVASFRRADEREVSLGEFPMTELLAAGETSAPRRWCSPFPTGVASGR